MMALGAVVPESDLPKLGAEVPDYDLPDSSSVMNPNPVSSRLREIGKTIGKYDPTIPSNMGRVGPPIAGAATVIGGGLAGGPAGAIAGAAAAPYVEAGVSKALGGNPSMPTWQDSLKSAATQAVFEGAGKLFSVVGAPAERATMEGLPPEFRTVKNMNQAIRNRDFWKALGLPDSEIDAAMANPKEGEQVLKDSIDRTGKIKQTFQDTIDSTRAKFKERYDNAMSVPSTMQVRIKAALKDRYGHITSGGIGDTHSEIYRRMQNPPDQLEQGWVDPSGKWLNRREAMAAEVGGDPHIIKSQGPTRVSIAGQPVDIAPVQKAFDQASKLGAEHELTGQWKNFLQRKANELAGEDVQTVARPGDVIKKGNTKGMEPGMRAQFEAQARGVTDNQELIRIADEARAKAAQGSSSRTFQGLRDTRTELMENNPANGTNLDKKAFAQVLDTLNKHIDAEGERLGMSREQIGQMHGIDEDWGRFQDTLKTLNPRSEKFGQDTADALFKTAQQHPEQALQFVQMAKDADKLPEFRQQFLENIVKQPANRGTPTNQMEFLRSFQNSFGTSDAGKAVLAETFGKNSPLADPITMSKVLGAVASPETQNALVRTGRQAGNVGYMVRLGLFSVLLGGSPYVAMRHPDKLPALIGGMAALAFAPSVLAKMSSEGQRAYIKMVTNPSSVDAIKNFSRVAGATITGLESTPPSQE